MLLKLLKYELRSNYLKFIALGLIYILITGIVFIFFRSNRDATMAIVTIAIIALCVISFMIVFQRYNTNLYGSEGYLMFTLPVDGRSLLMSKLLASLFWTVVYSILIAPTIIILIMCYDNSDMIGHTVKFIKTQSVYTLAFAIKSVISSVLSMILIYFCISVSKLAIWRKFGVLIGFITYGLVDLLCSVPTIIVNKTIENSDKVNVFTISIKSYSTHKLVIECIFDIVLSIALFFATAYILDKRTSLK